MITKLVLTDFKAFGTATLDLAPLTLLLGPNNSGKSSLIAPIRLLTQTMESYDVDVPLLLNGPFGDFGTFKDLVHGNHRGRPLGISFELRVDEPRFPGQQEVSSIRIDLEYKHRTRRRETILREVKIAADGQRLLAVEYSEDAERHTFGRILEKEVPPPIRAALGKHLRMRHFLPHVMLSGVRREGGEAVADFLSDRLRDALRLASSAGSEVWSALSSVEYVGARREPPQRTYLFSGEKRRRVGSAGEYATSLFMLDTMRRGKGRLGLRDLMSGWLQRAGIADDVFVDMISDRHYELKVKHPLTGESQNFSDVGYGTSQVFPILVAGFMSRPGSILLLEEPEIHLHPRAQSELGDLFLGLVQRRVQSVVETHSEYLMLRLQRHVASGELRPDDIAVYYVEPKAGGIKRLSRMHLDEEGRFTSEWPAGFFPERLDEARALSLARSRRIEKAQ